MNILSKIKMNNHSLEHRIRLLSPWWHDIYIPELDTSTHKLCGIDVRLLQSYDVHEFPKGYFNKTPLSKISGKKILEIGPASGFYTLKLAQQNNIITCIEREPRFINQLKFLSSHFHLKNRVSISEGNFPDKMPIGKFDVIVCLGVLYHIKDYIPFLKALNSYSANEIYLETHISKANITIKALTNEGYAFSNSDIDEHILKNTPNYKLAERINFNESKNEEYNNLPYYRCLLSMQRIR